ncbi:MAG: hypothetical protein JW768_03025 [Chitinispirillaceae bacterium]|nr:hypothetical protein [Chitinispirillaceae bacterium]
MASLRTRIKHSLTKFFAQRKESHPAYEDLLLQVKEPVVFDTITLESIINLRGQNPFPEEEGEMSFMNNTLRERSLISR